MKKLIKLPITLCLALGVSNSAMANVFKDALAFSSYGSVYGGDGFVVPLTTVGATSAVNPVAGAVVSATMALYTVSEANYYQGLSSEAIEVLAGNAELEELPSLSMFKEDVLAQSEVIEDQVFEQAGHEVNLEAMSDEDFALLSLQVQKNL